MAYVSQELKAKLAPQIKEVLKKYNVKGSLGVRHYSGLVLKVKEGSIDFFGQMDEDSRKYYKEGDYVQDSRANYFVNDSVAQKFINEVRLAMNDGNHNNSDIMTDYYDVGWYVYVQIGDYKKPYQLK